MRVTFAPVPVLDEEDSANGGSLLLGACGTGLVGLAFCEGAPGTARVGIGGISDFTSGGGGTGLVGMGGIADAPDSVPETLTGADEDDDDCAVPAVVVSGGIAMSTSPCAA